MKIQKHFIRLTSLLIILSLLFALSSCFVGEQVILPKEEITANMEAETNTERAYVTTYLRKWDFPRFTTSKLQGIEIVFRDYFAHEIPSSYEMTKMVVSLFLDNFYDKIDLTDEVTVTDALIHCYVAATGDPYSIYRTAEEYEVYDDDLSGSFIGIGVSVVFDQINNTIEVESLIHGGAAEEVGIMIGDIIIAVDGERVEDVGYKDIAYKIRGEEGSFVDITVKRGDKELTYNIERRFLAEKSVTYALSEDGIGYIKITGFKENTTEQFKKAIDYMEDNNARGVIYDLRSNPGGYLRTVTDMLSYIAPEGTDIVSFSNDYAAPIKAESEHTFTVPTVVLCNGNTASAAELFTSAIRDFGKMEILDVKIVGETTYGKGVMQSSYPFTDGSVITLTVAFYYPPLGEGYDGVGIIPDVIVPMGEEGDAQFDAAYETIKELVK